MEFPQPSVFPSVEGLLYAEPGADDQRTDARRHKSTKRKQTILQLLDELAALKDGDLTDNESVLEVQAAQGKRGHISHDPAVDDRLQDDGAQLFAQFDARIRQIDEQLLNFGDAVRPLGSSVGLIASASFLRARLQQILHLFRENSSDIFPYKYEKEPIEPMMPLSYQMQSKSRIFRRSSTRHVLPNLPLTLDLEEFPHQFELLAIDVVSFLNFLQDIPEFRDENLNASVLSFEGDLKYWASCLQEFEGQFQYPEIKRYVNELLGEMDEPLVNIRDALLGFIEQGTSVVAAAQNRTQSGLQNMSTVATFLSGVTATTYQFTFDKHDNVLERLVNTLWITSLVFSMAASINSQLAYHWRANMYRSPRTAIPWWVNIWLTSAPLVCLGTSVTAFSAGLVCFTYSSSQGRLATVCSTAFTALTTAALLVVAFWFAFEGVVLTRTKGGRWLAKHAQVLRYLFRRTKGVCWLVEVPLKAAAWSGNQLSKLRSAICGLILPEVPDAYALPVFGDSPLSHTRRLSDASAGSFSGAAAPLPLRTVESTTVITPSPTAETTVVVDPLGPETPTSPETAATTSAPRARFIAAARRIGRDQIMRSALNTPAEPRGAPNMPQRQTLGLILPERQASEAVDRYALRPSRIAYIIPALKRLTPTRVLTEHQGLVRHLQFSPDGKFLATCSWDRKTIIWRVGTEEMTLLHTLAHHGTAGFIGQVAWSPNGNYLLTKMHRGVKVWSTKTGVAIKTLYRENKVETVTWLPSGSAFACVEHGAVHILDLHGTLKASHNFERLEIHDVAFTPDEQRMLLVTTLRRTKDNLVPSKSRAEKRILVYHLDSQQVENQVPVLKDVRDITITNDGSLALVSYESTTPPQLWRINISRDKARLVLQHTYTPATPIDFAGPSYFGGSSDRFVIGAAKKGDVNIWDRETGLLLHSLPGVLTSEADLTAVAWNQNYPGQYMFATASHDGMVMVWTAPAPPETQPPSRAESPAPFGRALRPDIGVVME